MQSLIDNPDQQNLDTADDNYEALIGRSRVRRQSIGLQLAFNTNACWSGWVYIIVRTLV